MKAFAVKKALEYMDKDPETNLPKLMDWFDKFDEVENKENYGCNIPWAMRAKTA